MSVARKARAVRAGDAAARSAAHVSKRPARQGQEQTKKRDLTIGTERRCARSMTSRSAPSEIATVAGKMKVEVVRPADDGGCRLWLTIKLDEGPPITKLGRRTLYRRSSLQAWLRARERHGHSDNVASKNRGGI
jgi:hypothetical protein